MFSPFRIAAGFVLAGFAWVVATDALLFLHPRGPEHASTVALVKGLLFVAAAGLAIWSALERTRKRLHADREALLAESERVLSSEHDARRRAEDAQAHMARILESIRGAFFALDREWRFTYVNAETERLLRRPRADLLGRVLWDAMPESLGSRLERELRHAMEQAAPARFEIHCPWLRRWIDTHVFASEQGLSVFLQDVNDRKETELELVRLAAETEVARRQAEEALALLDTVFESAPLGFAFVDPELRLRRANDRLAEISGISLDLHLGRTLQEAVGELDPPVLDHLHRVLATGVPVSAEAEGDTPFSGRGGRRWWYTLYPVRGAAGEVAGAGIVVMDVTESRRAEEERRHAEGRYRRLVETSPYGIFALDLRTCFTEVNPAGAAILGVEIREVLGRPMQDFVLPKDLPLARQNFEQVVSGECEHLSTELSVRHASGQERRVQLICTPEWEDGRITGLHGIAQDVTETRRTEEELRQAQKLEAVGRLAGGVAHDFNNMLTVISGFAVLLEGRIAEDPEARSYLQQIQEAARRSAELTRQLLAFSRRQILKPKVLDPNEVVRELAPMLRRLIGEDVDVVLRLDPEPVWIRVDPTQVEQVLLNLAVNARDAMPDGGTLTISTGSEILREARRSAEHEISPGRYACLTVRDTGAGMDPETVGRVFEPFFTTKAVGKGTGLGLAMVYGVVTQSGGFVDVESAPGRGSVFRIYLPAVEAAAPEEEAERDAGADDRGVGTIVLVEDEDAVRALLHATLRRGGYRVLAVSDGMEALDLVERLDGRVDLVVTDVVMPRMSGGTLAELLRDRWPDLRFLFISGYTDEGIERAGVIADAGELLQKPFTPAELANRVRLAMAAGGNPPPG